MPVVFFITMSFSNQSWSFLRNVNLVATKRYFNLVTLTVDELISIIDIVINTFIVCKTILIGSQLEYNKIMSVTFTILKLIVYRIIKICLGNIKKIYNYYSI